MGATTKLLFMCGKMAAGKSTLARELADRENAVLLSQDEFVEHLFPHEIVDIPSYVKYSNRLNAAIGPLVCSLLAKGVSVVLDFPGNTRRQRTWFRQIIETAAVDHELHFLDLPDELCKRQLAMRSKDLPAGARWTTEAEFDLITTYFEPPASDEAFTVIRHVRG